ncbi:MAG: zinc-binding dehydrogenase [Acidimicrobiia bacterium]|nr:zinc-binding dehydrogenase [Acidimicrobiia bacterium]
MSESGLDRAVVATGVVEGDPLAGLAVVEAAMPVPGTDEVVVEVEAAALNHHDLWTLQGVGSVAHRFPVVLGSDGAGRGKVLYPLVPCCDPERCHGCRVGNASLCRRLTLLGEGRDGTMAPLVAVPAAHVLDAPANLTPVEASCLPSAWLTAWSMLREAEVSPGATVLVTGATGGVGVAALQLGAALGARMVAQVRRPDVANALEALGAEQVVTVEDDAKRVHGGEFDVVLESVGEETWAQSLRALRPGGTVVVAGATSGADPPADLRRVFWRRLRIIGVSMGSLHELQDLLRFVEVRDIHPAVAAVYPVAAATEAFAHLLRGSVLGKIVLEL